MTRHIVLHTLQTMSKRVTAESEMDGIAQKLRPKVKCRPFQHDGTIKAGV
jgi:hypothetical protein